MNTFTGSISFKQHSGFSAQPCISTGVLSLWAAPDPGFKWRLGIIDPLGVIMVCIPQDSAAIQHPHSLPPLPSAQTMGGSMATPQGTPTAGQALQSQGWQRSCGCCPPSTPSRAPHSPTAARGAARVPCPTPRKKTHPKTPAPRGAVPLWVLFQ